MRRIVLIASVVIAWTTTAFAQPDPGPGIPADARFEVATIKPGVPGESKGIRFTVSFTRVDTANTSVTDLLKYAYGLHGDQIAGGDEKLMHQGYAINAVVSGDTPSKPNADLLKQMLRNLLADRFGLVFHTETRELPVYILSAGDAVTHLKPTEQTLGMATGGYSPGYLSVHSGTAQEFAAYLQRFVTDRPVLDRTGITGRFDMEVHFTPADAPPRNDANAPDFPGIFTAVREQLGLKLTAARAPTPVFVIDHVTGPTAN